MSGFYLVKVVPGAKEGDPAVEAPMPGFSTFDDGPTAAKMAKELTKLHGFKVQPRRIAQAPDWRARERERFASNFYKGKTMPKGWTLPEVADHFPIVENGQIKFFESDANGILDRRTGMNPGRYIERFHKGAIGQEDAKKLIALIDLEGVLFLATTREEVKQVYEAGPQSCMSGNRPEWKGFPCRPPEVYAAGDLAVAYLKNKQGQVSARAVCWPEKKVYGRLYGDSARLERAFRDDGYKPLNRGEQSFDGAKLLKIAIPGKPNQYVMPYFDDIQIAVDAGDHFLCDRNENIDVGRGTKTPKVDSYIPGGHGGGGASELMRWCPRAKAFDRDSNFQTLKGTNERWSKVALERYAFRCEKTGDWYPVEQRVKIETGEYWSQEAFDEHGFTCAFTKTKWPKSKMVEFEGQPTSKWHKLRLEAAKRLEDSQKVSATKAAAVEKAEEVVKKRRAKKPVPVVEDAAVAAAARW